MRILHILDHSIPLHSGYTFRTRAILEQQQKLGWKAFQITSAKHSMLGAAVEEVDGLRFYRSIQPLGWCSKLPILNQWAIVQTLVQRLNEIIPAIKPDILHAHSPALNGMAALMVAKCFKLPVVYECRAFWEDAAVDHGTTTEGSVRYQVTRALETYIFKKADAITTICQGLRDDIITRGIPAEKITVVPNAVDADKFVYNTPVNQALKTHLGLQNKVILGFIGSFYAYEGLLLLLEALPKILQIQPKVMLLLVGGGQQEALIKQTITRLNLAKQVVLTGRVDHNLVQDYYNQVDILVYPRLSMRLTELVTPLKPLEAMAQGRLVLASDVGGHKELIQHKKNGYLFKANDGDALVVTVLDMLAQPHAWEAIRLEARHYVAHTRSWADSVGRYKAIYTRLVKLKHPQWLPVINEP
ncbi:TIGR04063 family PEP-CTERM/XrtA system glycosyltransferase [Crenothrix polyspora]|uniref:Membrane-anchored group 1 glycosyltransferase protein n=1 Tax=Crenothrix polyspora TaxID=360316 RepID=A0A1R4H9I9_9GAMM|nr:TIGR04063 family PEP-CTERM/XrtA system glycosyltransferase [Crenothrix polyspora]SJM92837.1 Membrane-anchored group 1 glycosyltransferase protein [Crenothrix polyspora]